MLVKVLDENRVKILMEDQDIAYYDLPFDKISDDDPVSKAFIYELLHKTYERTGMNFQNCRVMIEVVPGVAESYYILLTRIQEEGDGKFEFGKTEMAEREMYVFKLDRAQNVPVFFSLLRNCPPEQSDLYYWNDIYYVTVFFAPAMIEKNEFKRLLLSLEEFADRCKFCYANEGFLKEWGECLCSRNAYEVFLSK